ncbi:NAD(P)/FAD-dependent oxidoreductase [Glycomyces terrestris]|uniref:Oxidoreductase n=1 Tax=Glycomyces terrestris TaxID=2493553 RepID=A0A426UZY5_9ACTN|nr:FAD-dependent oxidoreductase [Glycomyces terrestris]RRS00157.1 oxidoreductase [Glycomyces terrestris]
MQHRIAVLGAGYAGAWAAGFLARHLRPEDVSITLVNAEPDFVERLRLHQVAAGQDLKPRPLADMFAGTGVRVRLARVTGVDADRRTVALDDGDALEYDTLLYALGSTAADHGVPGVAEHAHHVAARPAALRLRRRLDDLGGSGRVLVVGGNLTAIEAATEIAESRPGLQVSLATTGELGGWFAERPRRHLLRAFDRFGIAVHERTEITEVTADGAVAADGRAFAADAVVWAAGFAVHPIAAASGLDVQEHGRILVDRQMRSVSHSGVYAAGDAVFTIAESGEPLPMSCASAGFTAMQATAAIIGDLTGGPVGRTALAYYGNHLSLGRRDAIFQPVNGRAQATGWHFRGRTAAFLKESVLRTAAYGMAHPTFGKPVRRRALAAVPTARREAAVA